MTPPSPSSCSIDSTVCTGDAGDLFLDSIGGLFYIKLNLSIGETDLYDVPSSCDNWNVTVGDTLAIACTQSTTPYTTLTSNVRKNKWYPFKTPWAPAQVLAIYKTKLDVWELKIRWFYWHDDLEKTLQKETPKRKNQVFEHYHVQSCDASAALGRICLDSSSQTSSKRRSAVLGNDGMPRVFLTCQHAVVKNDKGKESLKCINDWNGQRDVPPSALKRGISNLENVALRTDTLKELQDRGYFSVHDNKTQESNTDNESVNSQDSEQDKAQQEERKTPRSVVTNSTTSSSAAAKGPFYQQDDVSYYWKLPVSARPLDYVKSITLSDEQQQWTIQVGDLVAVEHDDSSKPSQKKPWFPFHKPWSPAQVLALSHSEEDGYMVHVRWLYRCKDFDLEEASEKVRKRLDSDRKSEVASKIVYEHEVYNVEDLDSVLGRVVLTSNGNPSGDFLNSVQGKDGIPQAPLICRSLISEGLDQVTRIDDWKMVHSSGPDQLKRGIADCLAQDQGLHDATLAMLSSHNVSSTSTARSESSALPSQKSEEMPMKTGDEEASKDEDEQVKSSPPQSNDEMPMDDDDEEEDHTPAKDEEDHHEESPLSQNTDTTPADDNGDASSEKGDDQVTMDQETSSNAIEPRPSKRPTVRDKKRPVPEPSECDDEEVSTSTKRQRSIRSNKRQAHEVRGEEEEMLSSGRSKRRSTRLSTQGSKDTKTTSSSRMRRSRRLSFKGPEDTSSPGRRRSTRRSTRNRNSPSTRAKADDVNGGLFDQTLGSFVNDAGSGRKPSRAKSSSLSVRSDSVASSTSSESEEEEGRIFIPDGLCPFHQDFTALRSYYSEIDVIPDTTRSAIPIPPESRKSRWTVKMGDVVIVQYKQGADRSNDPFTVSSAVAEVVAIWKEHESMDAMKTFNRKNVRAATDAQDDVKIEIRWFYRKNELPGSAKTTSASDNATKLVEYEQLFETDLMDECDAESLLASAELHETSVRLGPRKFRNGMPLEEFHCCQFWSIHRKSLMPISSLDGRIERGRMHSKYLGKGGALSVAWREFNSGDGDEAVDQPKNWKQAFQGVIENLGLSAASEEASVRGLELTGREKEQEKIMTFLRSRIIGASDHDDEDDSDDDSADEGSVDSRVAMNASLFVAGPPGTGKTASVLSVITRLRNEQAKGKLPAFEFVSLNGMEMRHPFEAYVKFWEIISGPKKQKCPPEVAVAKLERHFAGRGQNGAESGKSSPVVVLLLDEIDYLVTKKQTVLYNFFDWPRRTMENGAGPRLIVVGISNTLNLPSRLKPSVQSRLGGEICGYKSYNVKDMVAILKTKIQSDKAGDYQVFEDDAVQFAARKTAALSGDIRKALHICKAAAETVMKDVEAGTRVDPKQGQSGPIVRISDVQRASRESFSSILSKAVAFSTSFEALVLVSLASLTQSTGRQDGGFDINELITKMEALSGGSGDVQYSPAPSFGETLEILNRLGETRLVSLHTPKSSTVTFRAAQGGSGGAWPLISLPMDSSNVRKALRDTPHSALAEKYITSY